MSLPHKAYVKGNRFLECGVRVIVRGCMSGKYVYRSGVVLRLFE